jgi:hypothetical protein
MAGDSYQAIYDAVRSRITGGNVADAVTSAVRDALDFSFARDSIQQAAWDVAADMRRPSVLFRPMLVRHQPSLGQRLPDPPKGWSASYGELSAYGASPAEAMENFDKQWAQREGK